ncbi:hypothetical protein GQ457_03G030800 [Hibiscus cannabinus]
MLILLNMPVLDLVKSFKLKTKQQQLLIRVSIICLVYILAFITRLFSVLHYKSMMHEFFDYESWYPLNQIVGGTLYPGLMVTVTLIYRILHFLCFAIHISEVCVLMAPFFALNTTLVVYFFGKRNLEYKCRACHHHFIRHLSWVHTKSVVGSYANEGVVIFALFFMFYLFMKVVNTRSLA